MSLDVWAAQKGGKVGVGLRVKADRDGSLPEVGGVGQSSHCPGPCLKCLSHDAMEQGFLFFGQMGL